MGMHANLTTEIRFGTVKSRVGTATAYGLVRAGPGDAGARRAARARGGPTIAPVTTVFSRIIAGELPGHFVWRDEEAVAFLSINPIQRGHTLVVPIAEIDHWIDAPTELNQHLMGVAHAIGEAQMDVFRPDRVGLIVAGFEVPHLHVHVIPTFGMADLDFGNAGSSSGEELAAVAEQLREGLRSRGHSLRLD